MSRIALPLRTFFALALPYFRSEERWRAGALLAAIVVVELALVYLAVLVNEWNAGFFNAIQDRNFTAFIRALGSFAILAAGMVVVTMGQYYFGQSLIIGWRRFMTERYVSLWMRDGRHYKMRFVAENVDNIHLRIANDVYLFVQRTHELATNLLGSIVALLSFIVILWGLSALAPLTAMGLPFDVPGYLVWAALLYAGLGTLITHWIGRPLIPLNFNQQRYESDFRFAIARVTDHSEPVALMRGEPIEREELGRRFGALHRVRG